MNATHLHFFPGPDLEASGPHRRGRPSYRWVRGYCAAMPTGGTSQALTRSGAYHLAKQEGRKARFFESESDARAAYYARFTVKL